MEDFSESLDADISPGQAFYEMKAEGELISYGSKLEEAS